MIEFSSEAHHKVNTINGFLTFIKGDFVNEGDEFDYEGYHFKVLSVQRRCAEKIKVTKSLPKKTNNQLKEESKKGNQKK
jgi:CBS domain containing-hemolysin-like protein